MYLLKKIIQIRENSHQDHEKPFLEHLEDLRTMITRIVITLVVSMIACFAFNKYLMDVLRRPVEQVWINQLDERLPKAENGAPKPLDVDTWEAAKVIEHAASSLGPAAREVFERSHPDLDLVFHARSVGLLRAALALPDDRRAGFLDALELDPPLKRQVELLVETAPSPEIDSRGNLRLMSALRPTETFMLSMKLSFFAGIIISFPLLLMFILQFVLPGLHKNEKRVMWPAMAIGFGLFLTGVFFAYFAVLPRALNFFYEWGGSLGVSNDWRIGEYISFATRFTLLFGLSFELPVVVMVLVKLGLLNYDTMQRTRSYAIVAIFIAAAVLTPTPDILTMLLMATPMLILYEICIWLAWFDRRRNRREEEREARESEERRLAIATAAPAATSESEPLETEGPPPAGTAADPYALPAEDPWVDPYAPPAEDPWSDPYAPPEDPPAEADDAEATDQTTDQTTDEAESTDEPGDDGWTPEYEDRSWHEEPGEPDFPPDRGPEESKSSEPEDPEEPDGPQR